ncbi:hypothetical protein QMT07_12240 [Cronobacter sakazakii]|nr:hypothetical protein [Cronobacter sakazakii]
MSTISNDVLEKLSVRYRLLAKIHDGSESQAWEESALIVEELLALRKEREKEESAVCPKCGNTGLADSGGVQPWGEPILIECDCTAPVVPDDVLAALRNVAKIRLDFNDFDGDRRGMADCLGEAEEALIEVVNRRAAMLNQSQEVAETDTTSQQFESLAGKAVVPAGWKLVPVELTKEMRGKIHPFAEATCLNCGRQVVADCEDNVTASWNDMLAVAPEPCK